MATDVENEGNEKAKILKDVDIKEEEEKEKPAGVSVEEYKRLHNIGSRLSTENIITYKESAFLQSSSSDNLYYNVKIENDREEVVKEKVRKKSDEYKHGEGKSPNKEKSPNKTNKSPLSPEGKKQPKKKPDPIPMPGRRVRREASLNAMAMVNILFEKERPVPKSPKKRRSTSLADLSTEEKEVPSSPVKKAKNTEKKSEKKSQKKNNLTVIKSLKNKKEKEKTKILKANSLLLNKKMLKLKAKKKLEKVKKKVMKTKCDSEKSSDPNKPKKKRRDTRKAARTHEIVIPKRKRCCSGSTCSTCFQPLMCQHKSPMYWNTQDIPHSDNIPRSNSNTDSDDVKACINMDMTTSGYSLSRLQHIDSASYVNSMVQHPALSSHRCPQCAQAAGMIPGCQTYTLSGVGGLSSVSLPTVMPYPPAYGGSYTLPYPGASTLPHCSCPQCLYYSQPSTNISHQPLPSRDPCILSHPPISIQHIEDKHLEDSDTKVAEEIIDVGIEEFPIVEQSVFTKSDTIEKVRTKGSDSKSTKIKSKSSSSEKDCSKSYKKDKKEKGEVEKKCPKETKIKSPKVPKERKKSTSKKEAKLQRAISLHGWRLHGPLEKKKIYSFSLGTSFEAQCSQAIRHSDGDIIQVRDCVMLRSGPKTTDIPFVAKVTQFWEHPQEGDVMMSLLWYYHPEHTEGGRKSQHASCELFASKHRDENSVACIDDKGYVLTYNEYCRFRAERSRKETDQLPRNKVVPSIEYPHTSRLPPDNADTTAVFLCRQVYDFKLKRILKNPS
ncbi:uncharacterized protein LOC134246073 [Saccostrea cucullata]|uniref:uncharacterized protein LOC134246073 n=1 Tax=Saccostrea cuccullata TaxID=36930 RepID=UPI002ED1972B